MMADFEKNARAGEEPGLLVSGTMKRRMKKLSQVRGQEGGKKKSPRERRWMAWRDVGKRKKRGHFL